MTDALFPSQSSATPLRVTLRPYQQAAVDSVYTWFETNDANPLIVVPTGGGKSLIAAAFIHSVVTQFPDERILVLTHVRELIAQNHAALLRAWPEAVAGICSAGIGRREFDARILFAGIQTVYKKAERIGWVDLILIDEAHLCGTDDMGMYRKFLADLSSMNPKLKVIGLTATPYRTDSGRLDKGSGKLFGGIAYECDLVQLIEDGYLSRVISRGTKATIDTSEVHKRGGEFIAGELEIAAMLGDLVPQAAQEIISRAEGRKSLLLFCCGVAHAEAMAERMNALGVECECVFGNTPKEQRDEILARFKSGELRAISNFGVLTTGFDAPNVDLIALLRPTCSPGLYCLDAETEILTSHGWKGMGHVSVGDRALAYDQRRGAGCWSGVLATIQRQMDPSERWVVYNAPRANFRVTDQHRLLVRRDHSEPWVFENASRVSGMRDGVYMPTAVRIDQPGLPLTDAEIYLIGILMTDGTVSPVQCAIYQSERYPDVMRRIEDALAKASIAYTKLEMPECKGSFTQRNKRWRYCISAGDPRNGKPGKGIRYLFPWLDKDLSPALFSMSRSQFEVLLGAMWDGDGMKKENVDYTPRSKQICTVRQTVADRMQALATMHGYTANMRWEHVGRKRPIAQVTFTDRDWRSVGGIGKRPQIETSPATDEQVWCVETEHGSIVTRRRGKVTVMGNCQMVGRGLRVAPGKADCLVLDFGQNVLRHGPIDHVQPTEEKSAEPGEAPMKECPECLLLVAIGVRECPECGYAFPPPLATKHDPAPDERLEILRGKASIERWDVQRVAYREHRKEGKPNSLRVDYQCGFHRTVSEWVCFEHTGFARRKAEQWWKNHGGAMPVPETVDMAHVRIDMGGLTKRAVSVTVDVREKWPKLMGVRLEESAAVVMKEDEMPF